MQNESAFLLPAGTVTFLLTDIEGSSRLWEADDRAMSAAVARHYEILDDAVGRHNGVRPVEQGEGDSVVAAFSRASDAVAAALEAQRAFAAEQWPVAAEVRVRIALHTGEAQLRDEGNYFGAAVGRCARLRSIGHGGQTLLSQSTCDLVLDRLPEESSLVDLGEHRLRDLTRPEHVWQLCHAGLPGDFPPLNSLDAVPNNLPLQLTSFIGREAEIAEIRRLLSSSRILTLTGSGGCGKTRLALQIAAEALEDNSDGAWWADLAPVSDPDLVPAAVAAALSIREVPSQNFTETIRNQLRDRRLLIVLDNCEHLISACSSFAEVLLLACPSVTFLATSREPLGLPGETAWRVPSLSLPSEKDHASIDALNQCEAVRLFIDRALKSRPNFQVTNENAPAVAHICQRLDGIPLAIELAAARARVLTPAQIAEGLADRFVLLTGGARTALPRQRTLEASVAWSHDLLSEPERIVFRRLSVFVGGFTLDAAEAVCAGDGIEEVHVLDLLSQLVDRSLVQMEEEGAAARFRLLETIRDYGRHKLSDSGEGAAVRTRHLDYYLALAERAEPELERAGLWVWADRLDKEHDNLRAAMDWSLHSEQAGKAQRLPGTLFHFWVVRNGVNEGRRRVEAALQAGAGDPAARAKALGTASGLAVWALDLVAAFTYGEELLVLGRDAADLRIIGRALMFLGWRSVFADPPAAQPLLEEAVAAATEAGDTWYMSQSRIGLGFMEMQAGNFLAARQHLRQGRAIAREAGDYLNTRESLIWLGWTAVFLGELPEAESSVDEALVLVREMRDSWWTCYALLIKALVAVQRGNYGPARDLYDECLKMAGDDGNAPGIGAGLSWLGCLEYTQGELEAATAHLEEGLALARELEFNWLIANCLVFLAWVAGARGDGQAAKAHLEEAFAIARTSQLPWALGRALLIEAKFDGAEGDLDGAEGSQHEALGVFAETSDTPGVIDALEALAGTAAVRESHHEAARLAGAAGSLRQTIDYARFPIQKEEYEADIAAIRAALGDEAFEQAWAEGAALSLEEAVAYASRARGERKRPSSGWASLTPTELEVVRLAAKGLTNPQIGEHLFISRGTAKVHLSHVFAKLSVSTRAELAAEATRRGI
jgi:predicted ATPase/class 3 adenylate cyclase/DNA-binding CsgD family transcriptional regulator